MPCPSFPCLLENFLLFCFPNLLFLAFLDFLAVFFLFKEFLAILSVLPFFPKDFRGSASTGNPCLFGGFACRFPKRQGKEDQGFPCEEFLVFFFERFTLLSREKLHTPPPPPLPPILVRKHF